MQQENEQFKLLYSVGRCNTIGDKTRKDDFGHPERWTRVSSTRHYIELKHQYWVLFNNKRPIFMTNLYRVYPDGKITSYCQSFDSWHRTNSGRENFAPPAIHEVVKFFKGK